MNTTTETVFQDIGTGDIDHSTQVIERENGRGPRVVVIGRLHGNEPEGETAARKIASGFLGKGTLVVLPCANAAGARRGDRNNPEYGDLNDGFLDGDSTKNELCRAIWGVVGNADILVDLHSSLWANGFTNQEYNLGCKLFATAGHGGQKAAKQAIPELDDYSAGHGSRVYADDASKFEWAMGNVMGHEDDGPVVDAVDYQLAGSAVLVEVPKNGVPAGVGAQWHVIAVREFLRGHGVELFGV